MNPLPLYPWRCASADACDSAREHPCTWRSEAGPEVAPLCDLFRPEPEDCSGPAACAACRCADGCAEPEEQIGGAR